MSLIQYKPNCGNFSSSSMLLIWQLLQEEARFLQYFWQFFKFKGFPIFQETLRSKPRFNTEFLHIFFHNNHEQTSRPSLTSYCIITVQTCQTLPEVHFPQSTFN